MQKHMPVGIDDFAKVRESYYFVDKTGFLREFLKNHAEVTLFTRPRRFGKTLTMSMLRYFLDIEGAEEHRKLFEGLSIAEDSEAMTEQGTRPVLLLTLKEWQFESWAEMQQRIPEMVSSIFRAHAYLMDDMLSSWDQQEFSAYLRQERDISQCKQALVLLLHVMEVHYGRKPVLLLDEYDAPVQYAWEYHYYEEAIGFFRRFFSAALKSNPSLDFAVLTGVLRITKENIFSALNNVKVDSVLQLKYPEAFGFTPTEVEKITRDFGCEDKMIELRDWYDGYRFAGQEIYNPWSVVNYFDNGCQARTYWVNTSGNAILGEMLRHSRSRVLDKFETILQGGSIVTRMREGFIYNEIYKNENAIYTMLVTTGYLTTKRVVGGELGMQAELILPNRELRSLFRIEVLERYQSDDMDIEVEDLMRAFVAGDINVIRDGLSEYLEVLTSSFDAAKGKESFYHGFVLGMTATLIGDYQIRSNHESGYGRYDIAAFPKKEGESGMVIECKTTATEDALGAEAQEALAQIEEKDYLAEFRARGTTHVLRYGIAFCGKKVEVAMG